MTGIKNRNLWTQVLLMIVTCGLYSVYWYYVTCRELVWYLKKEDHVFLWTVLMAIPLANFYSYYKQGELFEELQNKQFNRWVIFILWNLFPPAMWWVIQRRLNELAGARAPQETS